RCEDRNRCSRHRRWYAMATCCRWRIVSPIRDGRDTRIFRANFGWIRDEHLMEDLHDGLRYRRFALSSGVCQVVIPALASILSISQRCRLSLFSGLYCYSRSADLGQRNSYTYCRIWDDRLQPGLVVEDDLVVASFRGKPVDCLLDFP